MKFFKYSPKSQFGFLILCSFLLSVNQNAMAKEVAQEFFFNKRTSYDIIIKTGEDYDSSINNVEILRFQEIAGKTFLVVRRHNFTLKDVEGFILFDSIIAILPEHQFGIRRNVHYPQYKTK